MLPNQPVILQHTQSGQNTKFYEIDWAFLVVSPSKQMAAIVIPGLLLQYEDAQASLIESVDNRLKTVESQHPVMLCGSLDKTSFPVLVRMVAKDCTQVVRPHSL